MLLGGVKNVFVKQREVPPQLSPADKKLIAVAAKRRKPLTANEIIQETGLKRRNVYARLSLLVERGFFKNDGGRYVYIGQKTTELRVTPFMGIMSGIGAAYSYATGDPAVMFFAFLTFVVSYFVEGK